jgi:hypothetical protein
MLLFHNNMMSSTERGNTMAKDLNYQPCPKCMLGYLTATGERKGGFSGGKALAGAVIAGPIGLAAGALGRKKTTYTCNRCGYTVET